MKQIGQSVTQEYPSGSRIKIRKRINRTCGKSYGISWQVDISERITGNGRNQQSFSTLKEAKAFCRSMWDTYQLTGRGLLDTSETERADIALLLPRVRNSGYSIRELVEYALPRMRPKGGSKLFSELIHERVEALAKELEAGEIKPTYFEDCKKRGNYLLRRIDDSELNDINAQVLKDFFEGIKELSFRSKLNYWRQLNSILSLAEERGHLHQNPLSSFSKQDKKDCVGRDIKKNDDLCILNISETRNLLEDALRHPDYNLLPQFVVRLFCGIRTLEAEQLTWDDIRLDDEKPHVKVTSRIAKNRSRRNSDIPPNAVKWLSLFDRSTPFSLSADKGIAAQKHYDNLWKGFCIATGRWQVKQGRTGRKSYHSVIKGKNLLRHSFASYYYELTGDSMKTAEQMGHRQGDSVLFDTYYSLTNKGDGQKFFNITPKASKSKIIQMPRTA